MVYELVRDNFSDTWHIIGYIRSNGMQRCTAFKNREEAAGDSLRAVCRLADSRTLYRQCVRYVFAIARPQSARRCNRDHRSGYLRSSGNTHDPQGMEE